MKCSSRFVTITGLWRCVHWVDYGNFAISTRQTIWRESLSLFESFRTILQVIMIVIICSKFDCISGLPFGILGEFCSRKLFARANLVIKKQMTTELFKMSSGILVSRESLLVFESFRMVLHRSKLLENSAVISFLAELSAYERSTEFFRKLP